MVTSPRSGAPARALVVIWAIAIVLDLASVTVDHVRVGDWTWAWGESALTDIRGRGLTWR